MVRGVGSDQKRGPTSAALEDRRKRRQGDRQLFPSTLCPNGEDALSEVSSTGHDGQLRPSAALFCRGKLKLAF
ncbi:Dysferlin [Dissostichus eleginoides]|uniref:Dysferlin n=1 Tax=Dissostichus eleginoides TaxID=100907 RepID=A0AAD9BRI2_DISEL|nr:Dysferlin [Dissostichus eleginoides]